MLAYPQLPDWVIERTSSIGLGDSDEDSSDTSFLNEDHQKEDHPAFEGFRQSSGRDSHSDIKSSGMFSRTPSPRNLLPLGSMPVQVQEYALIGDLLYVFMGIEGKYVTFTRSHEESSEETLVELSINETLDASLVDLTRNMLPLAKYYIQAKKFISSHERFEYGKVIHRFSEAVKTFLKNYLNFLTKIEHEFRNGGVSIQKLWFCMQAPLINMRTVNLILDEISKKSVRGGALLNLLYDRYLSVHGDQEAKNLIGFLLEEAALPYFNILEGWIHRGVIKDPFQEFMIEEHPYVKKEMLNEDFSDVYWEQRYTLRSEHVPQFMVDHQEKTLNTGKYLNIIKECGTTPDDLPSVATQPLSFKLNQPNFSLHIDTMCDYASRKLLMILKHKFHLNHRLRMIKNYLLLDQGDYLVHLMDMADDEFKKECKSVNLRRLQSLLELSVRSGSAYIPEALKDDLRCSLASTSLVEQLIKIISVHVEDPSIISFHSHIEKSSATALSCFEAFTLDIRVTWPVNLILNRKALIKYQMLFRQLFHCKYVERLLNHIWLHLQRLKKQSHQIFVGGEPLVKTLSLHQRMIHFIRHMQNHLASQVIDQNWQHFMSKMSTITTVDELLKFHTDFLDTCLKQAMLTNAKLLKLFSKLFHVCIVFSNYMDRFSRLFLVENHDHPRNDHSSKYTPTRSSLQLNYVERLLADETFYRAIIKFDENFTHHFKLLIDGLHFYASADCEDHMLGLLCQLDYNYFFSMSSHRSTSHEETSASNLSFVSSSHTHVDSF